MFLRLAIVFLFTGVGQFLSFFVFKYASYNLDSNLFRNIAQVDSHMQFLLTIIALGLQSTAIRDIAISDNWKEDFQKTQSARLTLSLFLLLITLFTFKDSNYIIYIIAPLLALSGDYALYARGFPMVGAIIAFLRVLIPLMCVLVSTLWFKQYVVITYVLSLFFTYIITNFIISKFLKFNFFIKPNLKDLILYLKSLPIGIVLLGFYFLGLGIVIIADFFYTSAQISLIFIIIKFYVIYKGVLRIIHQSFIKEMQNDENCLKIDKLSILIGLLFFGSTLLFPTIVTNIFFGEKFKNDIFSIQIIGLCALIYSLFLSLATKAILDKKDIIFLKIMLISNLFTALILIITFYIFKQPYWILISLLIGEAILSIGLAYAFLKIDLIKERLVFLFKNILLLIIPFCFVYFFGEKLLIYIISFLIFGIFSLLLNLREFKLKH